jgi:hypothetical protein
MDNNHNIYRSDAPKPEDIARLDGFVAALKETKQLDANATIEEAVKHIEKVRSHFKTLGAFGAPRK